MSSTRILRILPLHNCLKRSPRILPNATFVVPVVTTPLRRSISTSASFRMPDTLTRGEVNSQTDPSVSKQYDSETPADQKIQDFFNIVDGKKVGLMNTYRNGVGKSLWNLTLGRLSWNYFSHLPFRPRWSLHDHSQTHRTRLSLPRKRPLPKIHRSRIK